MAAVYLGTGIVIGAFVTLAVIYMLKHVGRR